MGNCEKYSGGEDGWPSEISGLASAASAGTSDTSALYSGATDSSVVLLTLLYPSTPPHDDLALGHHAHRPSSPSSLPSFCRLKELSALAFSGKSL